MQAGKLRHAITIQQETVTRDAVGAEVLTWGTFLTARASIENLAGAEAFSGQIDQRLAQRQTKITIRARDGLTTKMRVLHGSTIYNIQQIIRDTTQQRQIDLICEEINI